MRRSALCNYSLHGQLDPCGIEVDPRGLVQQVLRKRDEIIDQGAGREVGEGREDNPQGVGRLIGSTYDTIDLGQEPDGVIADLGDVLVPLDDHQFGDGHEHLMGIGGEPP